MSTTVDQRIVEMQFDNRHFEKNVATTMSTLDKFKNNLRLDGATRGLDQVDAASKKINFASLGNAVETVQAKFSALQVMAVTALANITNSAVNAGKRIVSALTIDPIKTGFSEYETKINSVQTIMSNTASKGTTMADVTQVLNELNTYADKTIYNFAEMTRNIGTFTAAGIGLEESASAIQGIANLAAVSGSNSQQASTAMYQLSQAMASGTVKLMDWNSVVNAGMGGQVFQDALKATARAHGVAVDDIIKKNGSFRESLKEGWITSEILTETLSKMTKSGAAEYLSKLTGVEMDQITAAQKLVDENKGAGASYDELAEQLAASGKVSKEEAINILKMADNAEDAATKVKTFTQLWDTLKESAQSGWSQTWEILIGDFEEAKEFLTEVSDVIGGMIGKSAEARNNLLQESMTSNWDKLVTKINEAGIETSAFEDKVKDVAKSHGLDVESLINKHGSLKEAIRSGAISTDILREAVSGLSKSIADLSGVDRDLGFGTAGEDVKQVQQALKDLGYDLGSFGADGKFGAATQEAIKAFQKANDLEVTGIVDEKTLAALEKATSGVDGLADSCDDLISNVTQLGGRENIIQSLWNVFNGLISVVKPIKEAFREIFPPMTAKQLLSITESIRDLTAKFKLSDAASDKLKRTFKGLFAIIDIVKTIISSLFTAIKPLFGGLGKLSGGLLGVTANMGDWLVKLSESIKTSGMFVKIFGTIVDVIQKVIGVLVKGVEVIKPFVAALATKFKTKSWELLSKLFGGIASGADAMKTGVTKAVSDMDGSLENSKFVQVLSGIWNVVKTIVGGILKVLGELGGALFKNLGNLDLNSILSVLNTISFGGIALAISNFTGGLSDSLGSLKGMFSEITGILDGVRGCFEAYQQQLKAGTLLKIASAIAILVASIFVLSTIDPESMTSALSAITMLFAELLGSMAIFNKISGSSKNTMKACTAMIAMSIAVAILAGAMKTVSDMDSEGLVKGILGIAALATVVVASAMIMSEGSGQIVKGATSLIAFALAIKIMASVCKDLSELSWEELGKGLLGLAGVMTIVTIAMNAMPKNSSFSLDGVFKGSSKTDFISMGLGLIALAAAMKIFASAVADFGSMDLASLAKGIGSIAAVLAAVTVAVNFMPDNMMSIGIGLLAIGAALKIVASAMDQMGAMSWEEIAKGLFAMGGALAAVVLALNLMPRNTSVVTDTFAGTSSSNMISTGVGLIAVATALVIMASALEKMGSMSLEQIVKGLATLGASLLILSAALNVMQGTLAGSAALLIAAAAIAVLTPALLLLSAMSWGGIAKSLIVLAGAFAILGVAGLVLGPLIPAILGLAGALALIGVTVLAVGAGVLMAGVGLGLLASGLSALTAALATGLPVLLMGITSVLGAIISLIPTLAVALGQGVIILCQAIVDAIPLICQALALLIPELIRIIIDAIPLLGEALLLLVLELVRILEAALPPIVDLIMNLLVKILDALAAYTPQIIDAVMAILLGVLAGIAAAGADIIEAVVDIIVAILDGIAASIGRIIDAGVNIIVALIRGIAMAVPRLVNEAYRVIIDFINAMADAIRNNNQDLIDAVNNLMDAVLDAIKDWLNNFTGVGGDLVAGFTKGIKKGFSGAVQAVKDLGSKCLNGIKNLLGIKSPSRKMMEVGKYFDEGFAVGITDNSGTVVDAASDTGALAAMAAQEGFDSGNLIDFSNVNTNMPPVTVSTDLEDDTEKIKELQRMLKELGFLSADAAVDGIFGPQTQAALAEFQKSVGMVGDGMLTSLDFAAVEDAHEAHLEKIRDAYEKGMTLHEYTEAEILEAERALVAGGYLAAEAMDGVWDDATTDGFKAFLNNYGLELDVFSERARDELLGASMDFNKYLAQGISGSEMKKLIEYCNLFGVTVDDVEGDLRNFFDMASAADAAGYLETVEVMTDLADRFFSSSEKAHAAAQNVGQSLGDVSAAAAHGLSTDEYQDAMEYLEKYGLTLELIQGNLSDFYKVCSTLSADASLDEILKTMYGLTDVEYQETIGYVKNFGGAFVTLKGSLSDFHEACKNAATDEDIDGIVARFFGSDGFDKAKVEAMKDALPSAEEMGKNMVEGVAKGISSNSTVVNVAMVGLALGAKRAFNQALAIHSPSRVFMNLARWIPEGLAQGIDKYSGVVDGSSKSMAERAIDSVRSTIGRIADVINSDIDTQPTIRPVLDLSGVQLGANAIDGMLNGGATIGVMANANGISSMMNRRIQNGVNGDVVSAINKLRSDISNLGSTTYQINGVTYDDGTNVSNAVRDLVRAARIERRV